MTPISVFKGRQVALFGLGGSGIATALSLKAGGAELTAYDDNPSSLDRARAAGIETRDLLGADWSGFAALVLAPGVPLTHPEPHWTVRLAQAKGVPVIGDIELFCRERAAIAPDAPFVAITGTNGKSTTTALVAHILRAAGRDVQMGGNIGTAILSLAPPARERVHVIEMSSFQIDLTPSLRPTVGVLLNVTPDHLDRHGTMDRYAAIKERLVAGAAHAVIGVDDAPSRAVAERRASAAGSLDRVSVEGSLDDGFYAEGRSIMRAEHGVRQEVLDLNGIGALRGAHNAQNAAAACAVCRRLGLDDAAIAAGMRSFPGLAHRMQEIDRRGRIIFVNDSKATNADSAEKALSSFPDGIFWILGGKAKEGGIEALRPLFGRVARAYLIGEASHEFAATLGPDVAHSRCVTLERAVAAAYADARLSQAAEPVVLLSPACASYDQYRNFELRGEHFRTLVKALD